MTARQPGAPRAGSRRTGMAGDATTPVAPAAAMRRVAEGVEVVRGATGSWSTRSGEASGMATTVGVAGAGASERLGQSGTTGRGAIGGVTSRRRASSQRPWTTA